jgi:putative transposase
MPNHFHFLVFTNEDSCATKKVGGLQIQALSDAIRRLQSHYAQGINQRFGWSGSLFRQRTKSKRIAYSEHAHFCMNYIHQNPLKAGMVAKLEDWPYSSFRDYAGFRKGTLCNRDLAFELLEITPESFYEDSYLHISPESLRGCF